MPKFRILMLASILTLVLGLFAGTVSATVEDPCAGYTPGGVVVVNGIPGGQPTDGFDVVSRLMALTPSSEPMAPTASMLDVVTTLSAALVAMM